MRLSQSSSQYNRISRYICVVLFLLGVCKSKLTVLLSYSSANPDVVTFILALSDCSVAYVRSGVTSSNTPEKC